MNDMFEEIDKVKKELPEWKKVTNEIIGKRKLNFYQITAIVVMIFGFFGGIVVGNLFQACTETSGYFQTTCTHQQFNIGLTLMCWVGTFLYALSIYGMGHIVSCLESIDRKMK